MKYSKSAIGLLTSQYRSVLKKCWLINVGLFALGAAAATPANAADTWQGAIDGTTAFMDSITGTEWDRSKPITGWGVDQVLGIMGGAATATDSAVSLVNDASKGNNALYSKVNTLESDLNTAEGKISSLETSVGTKAESSTVTALAGRVTAAEGDISDLQTNKADKTTVNTISGKVSALETATADMATKTWVGEQGYQTSTDVTNAIKNSIENTTGPNTIGKAIADATDGMLTSTNYATTLDSVYAKVGDVPTKTSQLTNDSDYTTLADVVADAAVTTDGHLGKAIADAVSGKATLADVVADAAVMTDGHLGKAIKETKVDEAASADSAKAVTSDAVDGTTIAVNSSGKLEVNSITHAKVSDFDSQVESDISSSISTSGMALNTALATKVNNADNFTDAANSDLIKNKTVVAAIQDTAAQVDVNTAKNGTQDTALTNLYTAVNGGTYTPATGAVSGATALSGFTATNLTAAANELLGDITVTSGQVTTTNHLTAGADLAGNVVAVANSLASTEALVGTGSAPAAGTGILAGKTITGTAGENNLNVVDAITYVAANGAGLSTNNTFTGTNTFGSTSGAKVIIDNGGNLTANTSLKVGTDTTNMLTVSSTGTKIGDANAIVGTAGNLNMGGNALGNVASLTLKNGGETTTLSIDAEGTVLTGGADLDVGDGTLFAKELSVGQTDQFTVDASGNISTSGTLDVTGTATVGSLAIGTTGKGFAANGNLTAGTISATGIDTTTANTVKLGGENFTTAVTGGLTVSGDTALSGKLNVTGDTTLANTSVTGTLDVAGNTTLKNTSVDGTLDVTGKSTFGNATGSRIELNGGALTVKDSTQAVVATIDNDGNADFKGTLDVDGLASLDGGINVNDKFAVDTNGKVTLSDGTNTATIEATQIKDSDGNTINNVMKVAGTGLYTGYVASESGFTVAQKDGSTGNYIETFTVNADGEITGVGLTTDTTNGVDLGVAGTTTDIIGSAINIGGAATTTANLLAGTNGVNVSATGTDITGNFSVATDKFTVASDTGNTTVAGTMDIEGNTTIGDKFSVTATDGSMSAAGNKFSVDGNGAVRAANGEFIVDKDGNTKIKGALGAGGTGTEFAVGSDGSVKAAKGKFTVDKDGAAQAQSLAFNGDGATVLVNKIDQGAAAITDGVADTDARKQTMATTATVAKTIGNLAALYDGSETAASHGITNVEDVAKAIDSLSKNVETATGGTFAGTVWTGAVNAAKSVDYTYSPAATATATAGYHDIMSAVSQVASNVGAATTVAFNNVAAGNTVNANIDALNSKVGDMNTIGYGQKNLSNGTTTQPATVVEALQNIDASMGTIHGLAAKLESEGKYQGNLASGTTVEQHLTALDSAIGNRANFENMHYTKGSKTVVDAIGKLDTKLNSVDHEVRTMRHHYDSALASAAALSALVPNARAHGNTQLSLGTGMYHGHGAMAVGGFHWFSDNLLFNTGIAWDDNEATYRMGVTYSW